MAREDRSAIHDAYRRTTFRAQIDGERVDLRIGETSPRLDAHLGARGVGRWAFLTAWNPHAVRMPEPVNAARHAELVGALEAGGFAFFDGEGVGDAGDWPAERSVLVIGISEDDALRIARGFGQEAFVAGERARPARLVFCPQEQG